MYEVNLAIKNMKTDEVCKVETVKFYSLWGARCWGRDVIRCTDVTNVDIIDEETGELMLSLSENGNVEWDSEG